MWVRKIKYLMLFIFVAACARTQSVNLPVGITRLKGIDPYHLQSPIWSPDGKRIVASYVIEGLTEFPGSKPRHDIVTIDAETWGTSILISEKSGNLIAETWSPDSKSFAMFWSDGPEGIGNYLFEVDNTKSTYFSEWGTVSPNLEKVAIFDGSYIKITDINTKKVKEFKVPVNGKWGVYNWSPDMKQLALLQWESEKDGFNDVYLLELSSGKFLQFTHDKSYIKGSPMISPDGQFLAYTVWRLDDNFKNKLIISKLGQSCQWTIPIDDINDFAWAPDSQRMFLIGNEGVYLADLEIVFGNDFSNKDDCP